MARFIKSGFQPDYMRMRDVIIIIAAGFLALTVLVTVSYIFAKFVNPPLVDPEIERIIIEDMVNNGKRISVPEQLDMAMGETKAVYVGIKNDKGSSLNYRIEFDILADSQDSSRSYKSVLKYQGLAKSLEEGDSEVGLVDISIPQSDFSKGNYILKVSIVDADLDEIYASENISLAIG